MRGAGVQPECEEGGAYRALVASDLMVGQAFRRRALLMSCCVRTVGRRRQRQKSVRRSHRRHTGQTSGTRRGRLISLAQKLTVLQARHKRKKPQRRDRVPPLSTYSSSSTSNAHSEPPNSASLRAAYAENSPPIERPHVCFSIASANCVVAEVRRWKGLRPGPSCVSGVRSSSRPPARWSSACGTAAAGAARSACA